MDIHAPDRPVHSFKDFATHIAIVTIGILIALGLDGLREHFRERKLVRETRDEASEAIRLYTSLQRDLVTQEDSMAAFLLSPPHPAAADLSSMIEHLILLSRAERSAAYVGPQMQATVERALRAAEN